MTLRIALLGPPRVEVDGRPLVVDTRKAIALLAYLAVASRPIARASLAELLWPEADPDGGRGALRRTLSVLRSGLNGGWLEVDRHQVALAFEHLTVDVTEFRQGIARAAHRHEPGDPCPTCRTQLAAATDHYRGEFLEGFGLRDSPAFDEWQLLEAEALRGELAAVLRRLIGLEAAEGRTADAIAVARRLLALDPVDESGHQLLMRLYASTGDRAAIVRQYRDCIRALELELGVEPSPETTSLYRSLVDAPPAAPIRAANTASASALSPVAGSLLDAAAVLGAPFAVELAADVAELDERAAVEGIGELVRRGLVRESPGAAGYAFADDAVRGDVVKRLGLAERRRLHRRAGRAVRAALTGRTLDPAVAARGARHLAEGGLAADAAALYVQAGDAARAASRHADAAFAYRAALALGHPADVDLHLALGDVETLLGRYGEALAAYEAGAAGAPAARVAQFEQRLGSLHLRRGALDLADLHLAAAIARLDADDDRLRGRLLADRSLVALRRGDVPAAGRLARSALRAARAIGDLEAESQAENLLAMLARRAGDVDVARRHLDRSLARASLARHPAAQVAALNNLSLLERSVGELDRALELVEEALRRSVAVGDRHREAALRNNRADLLHALGRRQESQEEVRRSVAAFAEVGERPGAEPEIWKLVDW